MKGERILITHGFNGVWFNNFPAKKGETEEEFTYNSLDALAAEFAADDIADPLKTSVIVDFSKLDRIYFDRVKTEIRSRKEHQMSDQELHEMEQFLIEKIFGVQHS
ncbi:hypothetical protein [Sulfoacidibacillus ferrooxidans]|uniref:Uncharacterized protein n=1 Tax=Sulfoacidibacillus ferrooxidans TaxID=2005001 RepID=A0A9X1VBB5_9BACL|nr:hypothetical protein [Sulfoacidibacillus ferrooxidans]MCI0184893.1 hypothetical protein [Sulfoacidibacillus ferrooxidans]